LYYYRRTEGLGSSHRKSRRADSRSAPAKSTIRIGTLVPSGFSAPPAFKIWELVYFVQQVSGGLGHIFKAATLVTNSYREFRSEKLTDQVPR
jgi:hypothetical protein